MAAACAPSLESQLWKVARRSDTIPAYEEFLERFPTGIPSDEARERLQSFYESLNEIETIRIDLHETFMHGRTDMEIEDYHLPVGETASSLLRYAGLTIVEDSTAPADGILRLRLEGRAMSQSYAPANERNLATSGAVTRQYAGASLHGSVSLTTPAGKVYDHALAGMTTPPKRIGSADFPRPEDAPFDVAFNTKIAPELASMVGQLYGPEPLVLAVDDESMAVRMAAVEALGELGDTTSVQPLLRALEGTANFELKRVLVVALGQIGDARATEAMIDVLRSAFDSELRGSAAEALGQIGDASAVPSLIEALRHNARPVRRQAVNALGALTGQSWGTDADAWSGWWEQSHPPTEGEP